MIGLSLLLGLGEVGEGQLQPRRVMQINPQEDTWG
jgi:hypothetical protein